jgi:hypothetical protein
MTWTQAVRAMRKGHKVKRESWDVHAGHLWISLSKIDAREDGYGIYEFINSSDDLKTLHLAFDRIGMNTTPTFHIQRAMAETLDTDWEITE